MSTDRESLELAAKAAGISVDVRYSYTNGLMICVEGGIRLWNPRTNDGDALQLAAMLGIDLEYGTSFPSNTAGGSVKAKRKKDWSFGSTATVAATISYCRTVPILQILESDKKIAEYMSRPERGKEQWAANEAEATRRAIFQVATEIGRAMS